MMKTGNFGRSILLVSVGLFSWTGCGSDQPTYPVTGTVHYTDGKPLKAGTIEFESITAKPPVTARSPIGLDGSFTLRTFDKADGALPGRHRVAIIPSDGMNAVGSKEERPGIIQRPDLHPKYRRLTTSGLEEVVAETDNRFEFVVEYADR